MLAPSADGPSIIGDHGVRRSGLGRASGGGAQAVLASACRGQRVRASLRGLCEASIRWSGRTASTIGRTCRPARDETQAINALGLGSTPRDAHARGHVGHASNAFLFHSDTLRVYLGTPRRTKKHWRCVRVWFAQSRLPSMDRAAGRSGRCTTPARPRLCCCASARNHQPRG